MKNLLLSLLIIISIDTFAQYPLTNVATRVDSITKTPKTINPEAGNTILFGSENFTKSELIHGGNYFTIGYARRLFNKVDLELHYSFDIVPEAYDDNLIKLMFTYNSGRYSNKLRPYLSMIYMRNLSSAEKNNFYGLKFCPASNLFKGKRFYGEILAISWFIDFRNKDNTFCYEFMNFGYKF